jgi:hypothetical protein
MMNNELLNTRLDSATANLTLHAMRGEYKDGVTLQAIEEELSSSDSFWALFESLKIAYSGNNSNSVSHCLTALMLHTELKTWDIASAAVGAKPKESRW